MDDTYQRLGELVTRRMEWLGVSQIETAKAADISDPILRRIQRGQGAGRRRATLSRVLKALGWAWTIDDFEAGLVDEELSVRSMRPLWADAARRQAKESLDAARASYENLARIAGQDPDQPGIGAMVAQAERNLAIAEDTYRAASARAATLVDVPRSDAIERIQRQQAGVETAPVPERPEDLEAEERKALARRAGEGASPEELSDLIDELVTAALRKTRDVRPRD